MLCKISEDCVEDARRILKLLCFSSRPLTVAEVIDAYAVDLSEPCRLDCGSRRLDEESLFEICPGLIEVVRTRIGFYNIGEPIVRIAHFSVQEYLVSERILQQKAAKFSIEIMESHTDIACICLIYLLDPGLPQVNDSTKEYPLTSYAARFWISHYRQSSMSRALNQIVLKLFKHYESFITWIRIYDPDSLGSFKPQQFMTWIRLNGPDLLRTFDPHVYPSPSALYYSCLFGLTEPAEHLLQDGIDINSSGGRHGSALIAASWEGHENIVKLLLEKGADVNAQGGQYGIALQSACFWGYQSIVILLLEKGADVNCACGYYGFALQAACFRGHKGIAGELIRRGADVNAEGGEYGTALQAACSGAYLDVVKLLLEFGASVSIENGRYESALQAALCKGHNSIADLLCANGAALEGRPTSFSKWDNDYIFRLR